MNKDPLEFEETTKFNVIREYSFHLTQISPYPEKRLAYTHIQRKSHNNTKNKWITLLDNGLSSFSGDRMQAEWDSHVISTQKTKDVEDYIRETGSILGLL